MRQAVADVQGRHVMHPLGQAHHLATIIGHLR
jgi:hypothetical protein